VSRPDAELFCVHGVRRKKPARRYHHGDLRHALLEASTAIVDREGTEALTLREVARRLGVSHAAPSHHFADKTALLAAVAASGFEALARAMDAALGRAGTDPLERLKATGVAYVRFAVEHPRRFRLMFGPELAECDEPELTTGSASSFEVLVSAVTAALAARGISDSERIRLTTVSAWSLVHGLATLYLDHRLGALEITTPSEAVAMARAVTDLVARALDEA
jgi:AcrR family transcriptional regulator